MKANEQQIQRTGRIPEKEQLGRVVAELTKRARSLPHLQILIEEAGIKTYTRKERLYGIWNKQGTRKYRLRTLGIDPTKLERLISKEEERLKLLKRNRKQDRNRKR